MSPQLTTWQWCRQSSNQEINLIEMFKIYTTYNSVERTLYTHLALFTGGSRQNSSALLITWNDVIVKKNKNKGPAVCRAS